MPTPNSTPSNSQTGSQYLTPNSPPQRRLPPPSSSSNMPSKKPSGSLSSHNTPTHQSPSAASPRPATNIWQLMGYPIPRGPCRHKPGMLSSSCACLRFMLNPVVAGSTFCCDGCGHHASFHVLKGEYPPAEEGGDGGMVGMGMGEIIQSQAQNHQGQSHGHGHGQVQLTNASGTPGKGRGKRVVELEFDEDDGDGDEDAGQGEWVGEENGELMIVTRGANGSAAGAKGVQRRRIPGAFTNGHASGSGSGSTTTGNGTPAAKRSRV